MLILRAKLSQFILEQPVQIRYGFRRTKMEDIYRCLRNYSVHPVERQIVLDKEINICNG